MDMDSLKSSAASRAAGGGMAESGIKFSKGPLQFSNKSKSKLNQNEFPELGAPTGTTKPDATVSKKDRPYEGNFTSSFAAQANKNAAVEEAKEAKAEPKMPVFTRKMKATTDDSQRVENIPSSQNYDFTKMKFSQASAKPSGPRPEGEATEIRDGERTRGDYGGRGRGGFEGSGRTRDHDQRERVASSDSFEEVKERRKPQQFYRGSNKP